jgi:hypothetical protein
MTIGEPLRSVPEETLPRQNAGAAGEGGIILGDWMRPSVLGVRARSER